MSRVSRVTPLIDKLVKPVLHVESVSKIFGGTVALDSVTLDLFAGEIHALVGENGAGKSTLTKILCGVYSPDTGAVILADHKVEFGSPAEAQHAGISIIYQEPTVFPDLTVAENVFIGRQPLRWFPPGVDKPTMQREAAKHLSSLGVKVDSGRLVHGLSVAELQAVEMAGALTRRCQVLIVDEPTASLTPVEVKDLFVILQRLASEGVAILFIGHRLEEVFAIANRITVLRDGVVVSSGLADGYDTARIIREMVGRSIVAIGRDQKTFPKKSKPPSMELIGLSRDGVFSDISFCVRPGQIIALAGLVGSGRTEIARAIIGIDRLSAGEIKVADKIVLIESPSAAQKLGVVYVPEDRQNQGVALRFPIFANISLPQLRRFSRFGLMKRKDEIQFSNLWLETLAIKAKSSVQQLSDLSGGNQQKVVLAKWLAIEPRVLILDEPTRGVDVGAKMEIHRLIADLAKRGTGVLLISSDLPEVLALANEIVVIREGYIAGWLPTGATAEEVMSLAVSNRFIEQESGGPLS